MGSTSRGVSCLLRQEGMPNEDQQQTGQVCPQVQGHPTVDAHVTPWDQFKLDLCLFNSSGARTFALQDWGGEHSCDSHRTDLAQEDMVLEQTLQGSFWMVHCFSLSGHTNMAVKAMALSYKVLSDSGIPTLLNIMKLTSHEVYHFTLKIYLIGECWRIFILESIQWDIVCLFPSLVWINIWLWTNLALGCSVPEALCLSLLVQGLFPCTLAGVSLGP